MILGFDEINKLEANLKALYSKAKRTASDIIRFELDNDEALTTFEDILLEAYLFGVKQASYMVGENITNTEAEVFTAERFVKPLYKAYKGETIQAKVITAVNEKDIEAIKRLAESESHRSFNEGEFDYVVSTGKEVYKMWHTMQDSKVRETHYPLEGELVGIYDTFITNDGDEALMPGGFTKAENNANCRCYIEYLA